MAFARLSEGVCGSLVTTVTISGERQYLPRRSFTRCRTTISEEPLSYDFGLLLKSVAVERLARLDREVVAAKRMAHERQVEATFGLRLPHVRHFVDEKALCVERLKRKILSPSAAVRMQIDVAHGGHGRALWLKRPPFAVDHPHPLIVDGVAENRPGEGDFSGGEGAG